MSPYVTFLESTMAQTWGGGWITAEGQYLPLVNDGDDVLHHKHILDDYFPELDEMFYELWDEDDEVYGEESVNYAMKKGWLRVRTQGTEFNVQMPIKPTRAAMKALRQHLDQHYYSVFYFDDELGEDGGHRDGFKADTPEELLRAINQKYFSQ